MSLLYLFGSNNHVNKIDAATYTVFYPFAAPSDAALRILLLFCAHARGVPELPPNISARVTDTKKLRPDDRGAASRTSRTVAPSALLHVAQPPQ